MAPKGGTSTPDGKQAVRRRAAAPSVPQGTSTPMERNTANQLDDPHNPLGAPRHATFASAFAPPQGVMSAPKSGQAVVQDALPTTADVPPNDGQPNHGQEAVAQDTPIPVAPIMDIILY